MSKICSRCLRLCWVFIALLPVLILAGIGGYSFTKARQSIREEVQQTLATIAEQKSQQIELWLSNISQDTVVFSKGSFLADKLGKWLLNGQKDEALKKSLLTGLGQIRVNRYFDTLAVFDMGGQVVLTVGAADVNEHSPLVLDVIQHGQPRFVDLHKNTDGKVELGVMAPFVTQSGQTIGALYLTVNPEDYLYPMLTAWPVHHATAETILVRREGEFIEYVSPLYLLKIPAMVKRMPMHNMELPDTRGLRGYRGIVKNGTDYRGQAVLSYVTPIKGMPWVMVAKMDKNEAYAKIHRLGLFSGAFFTSTLLVCYLILFLVWRNQNLRHRLVMEQELLLLNQQLEQKVKERTDELHSLIHFTRDGFIVIDQAGRIVKVNPSFCRMLGYSEEELLAMHMSDIDEQEKSVEEIAAHIEKVKREGHESFQSRHRRKDGKIIDIDASISYLDIRGGILFSFIRDITDKRLAELQLVEKEMRWHVALDSHEMGVWDWSVDSGKVLFSPRWKSMLGYAEEDIESNIDAWEKLIHPDDKAGVMQSLQDYFVGKNPDYRAEIRLRTKQGGYRWIFTCGKVTDWSPDGKPLRMIGTHTDINEKKLAEAILLEREETFRKLFQDSLDPVILMKEYDFFECNQAALDLTRLTKEEFIGLTPVDISPEFQDDGHRSDEKYTEIINELLRGRSQRFDWHCIRRDGSDFYVDVSLTPIKIGGSPFYYCGWRDITLRKQLIKRLAETTQAAEAGNRAKGAFLANMSHEIRTPLNSILGMAQLLQMQGLEVKVKRKIQTIAQAAHHLLSIVNDILDISKIEAGKLRLEISDFPLREIIEGVVNLLADKADTSNAELTFEIAPDLPDILRGDRMRIRQILFNLVGNALKFTEMGKVTVRVLRMSPGEENFSVRFEVQDTGLGISSQDLPRLFNYFEQADNQSTRSYGGTGLGLAICKRLVEQMGGSIGVDSEWGVGSTFWWMIPLSKGSQATAWQDETLPLAGLEGSIANGQGDVRVLLVEDNETNQEIVSELLQNIGVTVDMASNGLEAITRVEAETYDLILMDIQMPKMDGLEATRIIRQMPNRVDIPILALTANAFSEDVDRYFEAGMNGHLAKPIIVKELYKTMLYWLNGKMPLANETGAMVLQANTPTTPVQADLMAHLTALPGLDTQKGLVSLAGKQASYIRQLRKFAERQPVEMANLQQALVDGDWITAKRIAHTLKGLAGTMGATSLQVSAQRLNDAFVENLGFEEISQLSNVAIAEYSALSDAILSAMSGI